MTRTQVLQRSLERCGAEYSPGEIEEACRRRVARNWYRRLSEVERQMLLLDQADELTAAEIAVILRRDRPWIDAGVVERKLESLKHWLARELESAGR